MDLIDGLLVMLCVPNFAKVVARFPSGATGCIHYFFYNAKFPGQTEECGGESKSGINPKYAGVKCSKFIKAGLPLNTFGASFGGLWVRKPNILHRNLCQLW